MNEIDKSSPTTCDPTVPKEYNEISHPVTTTYLPNIVSKKQNVFKTSIGFTCIIKNHELSVSDTILINGPVI